MDCESFGGITVTGNFAKLQDKMPEPFNYDRTAKWLEPYKAEWREVLGNAICNCTTVEVHYAPYYGWDHFHRPHCNLLRKLRAEPQIANLRETYLPSMIQYDDSVPNDGKLHIWVEDKTKRSKKVNVRVAVKPQPTAQLALI